MNCLLICLIRIGGIGHYDECPGRVEVVYSSPKFNYVKLLHGPTTTSDEVKIEMQTWQQVEKRKCSKVRGE